MKFLQIKLWRSQILTKMNIMNKLKKVQKYSYEKVRNYTKSVKFTKTNVEPKKLIF